MILDVQVFFLFCVLNVCFDGFVISPGCFLNVRLTFLWFHPGVPAGAKTSDRGLQVVFVKRQMNPQVVKRLRALESIVSTF